MAKLLAGAALGLSIASLFLVSWMLWSNQWLRPWWRDAPVPEISGVVHGVSKPCQFYGNWPWRQGPDFGQAERQTMASSRCYVRT